MVNLSSLKKLTSKSKRRVGRGYGSNKGGHTTGKGAKGQKIRTKVRLTNDGTKIKKSWLKRLPFLKGKGRTKTLINRPCVIKLDQLIKHAGTDGKIDIKLISKITKITPKLLSKTGVKVVSSVGKIEKALIVDPSIKLSASVKNKIVAAGGKIN